MDRKVLVPLDGSGESEKVLALLREQGGARGEVVLFRVVPPGKTIMAGGQILDSSQEEASERAEALSYLHGVRDRHGGDPARWRCEVAIHKSIAQAILDYSMREGVQTIAMYTHDRKGLARLLKGSIASDVSRRAAIEVRVFKPRDLAGVAA
jgi:nucleotide-binding universal stress UspA family protein